MKIGWLGMALLAGLLIPVQAAMNVKMRTFVLNPFYSALVSFAGGIAILIVVSAAMGAAGQPGNWRNAANAPWWAWYGGLIGVLLVIAAVLVVPRAGAAGFSVSLIVGQLIGALIIDHYGWFGLSDRRITPSRLAGAAILLLGMWLIQRK